MSARKHKDWRVILKEIDESSSEDSSTSTDQPNNTKRSPLWRSHFSLIATFQILLFSLLCSVMAYYALPQIAGIDQALAPIYHGRIKSTPSSVTALPKLKNTDYLHCQINDDPQQLNTKGIYYAPDVAVTIHNLKRLGIKHLFVTTSLHFPDHNAQETASVSSTLATLDSAVLSLKMARQAAPTPLPNYLERSTIATSQMTGDLQLLPKVNRLSLPPSLAIPSNCLVGFGELELTTPADSLPLLAKWENHILPSALLLEHLHQQGRRLTDLHIQLGDAIFTSDHSIHLPIDEYGHYHLSSPAPTDPIELPTDIISANITSFDTSPKATSTAILTAIGDQASAYSSLPAAHKLIVQLKHQGTPPHRLTALLSHLPIPKHDQPSLLLLAICALLLCLFSRLRNGIYLIFVALVALAAYFIIFTLRHEHDLFPAIVPAYLASFCAWFMHLLQAPNYRSK